MINILDYNIIKSDNLILTNIKNKINNNKNLERHNEILYVLHLFSFQTPMIE